MLSEAQAALSQGIDPSGPLEAAFVVRRTGAVLASWARTSVEAEVASVMAATLIGSIETLTEALRCPSPDRVVVETDTCRMLATRVEPQALLVLVAKCGVGRDVLQREASRVLPRVTEALRGNGGNAGRMPPPPPPGSGGGSRPVRRNL